MKKKVLIVDDSAFMRSLLTEIISSIPAYTVVYAATDPFDAVDKIVDLDPDIITLDVNMPKMDGLTFLEKIMKRRPKPVIIISSLAEQNSMITLKALELGAIDYILKPTGDIKHEKEKFIKIVQEKLETASISKPKQTTHSRRDIDNKYEGRIRPKTTLDAKLSDKLIAIGASTGGTNIIAELLSNLPAYMPAIVIVQHMPAGFTALFAERLNRECHLSVHEAINGEDVYPGTVYIAPGGKQMKILKGSTGYKIKVDDGEPVNRHKPSVDVLFDSVATVAGKNAVGIMLTGMGSDGVNGMLKMRNSGSYNLSQDEASCIVYGMPKVAFEKGAVHEVMTVPDMAEYLGKMKLY